jgi:hypothetical protein
VESNRKYIDNMRRESFKRERKTRTKAMRVLEMHHDTVLSEKSN